MINNLKKGDICYYVSTYDKETLKYPYIEFTVVENIHKERYSELILLSPQCEELYNLTYYKRDFDKPVHLILSVFGFDEAYNIESLNELDINYFILTDNVEDMKSTLQQIYSKLYFMETLDTLKSLV
jgi:hypothetical protein